MPHDVERPVQLVSGECSQLVHECLDVIRGSVLACAEPLEVGREHRPVTCELWQEVTIGHRCLRKPVKQENRGCTALSSWFGAMECESDTIDRDLTPFGSWKEISAHR
jgi:hypothetical protein